MEFRRFALYYAPPAQAEWTRTCTAWLGWDMQTGQPVAHPAVAGLSVDEITATPRKYGLHGTLKPPFRLADGTGLDALRTEAAALAARFAPVSLNGLELVRFGGFLALRPAGSEAALRPLADACVRDLDRFRAAPGPDELARRRGAGLGSAQEANLVQWGYPFVMELFRFHITLTGRLKPPVLDRARAALAERLDSALPRPFVLSDIALVGEAGDGMFHLLDRYPLSG